nr:histidine phosphatase family protein [Caldimonas mangrovi]
MAVPAGGQAGPPAVELLRRGGVAVLLRHAATVAGVGDPPGFRPGDCRTQRNLSEQGREQSLRIGRWFGRYTLTPSAVRSSAWCRCVDTAKLAFGHHQPWPVLDSLFGNRGEAPRRRERMAQALRRLEPGRFEVWVTHQANIMALTGSAVAAGEGLVVQAGQAGTSAQVEVAARIGFEQG